MVKFQCPNCGFGYGGYHECLGGPDRVEFECIDCGDHVNREAHELDIDGLTPQRCVSCTLACQ
jgi:hypothetical protein